MRQQPHCHRPASWLRVSSAWQVVYLTEVIDEPMFNHLEKFDGHQLIDVGREGVDLGDTEEDKQEVRLLLCAQQLVYSWSR